MAAYRAELAVAIFAIVVLVGYVVMLGSVEPRPAPEDVAVAPASPIGVPSPPVERAVYLVPFGDFPRDDADALVSHYLEKFDLAIEVLPSIPVPEVAMDADRDQLIAERLLDAIAANEVVASDPEAVVIGLTESTCTSPTAPGGMPTACAQAAHSLSSPPRAWMPASRPKSGGTSDCARW